jgi:hypothetical protein
MLDPFVTSEFKEQQAFFNLQNNYKPYRDTLLTLDATIPCLPLLGVLLVCKHEFVSWFPDDDFQLRSSATSHILTRIRKPLTGFPIL